MGWSILSALQILILCVSSQLVRRLARPVFPNPKLWVQIQQWVVTGRGAVVRRERLKSSVAGDCSVFLELSVVLTVYPSLLCRKAWSNLKLRTWEGPPAAYNLTTKTLGT